MNVEVVKERAKNNFSGGMNCSQSVLLAFVDELGEEKIGISHDVAMKLSSSFGGGMGRLREVCGAVSGMFMVAGLVKGYNENSEPGAKAKHYELIQNMAKRFVEKNGSIICRTLLGLDNGISGFNPDSHVPEARTSSYYKKRPCVELVGDAAEIVAELLFTEI